MYITIIAFVKFVLMCQGVFVKTAKYITNPIFLNIIISAMILRCVPNHCHCYFEIKFFRIWNMRLHKINIQIERTIKTTEKYNCRYVSKFLTLRLVTHGQRLAIIAKVAVPDTIKVWLCIKKIKQIELSITRFDTKVTP